MLLRERFEQLYAGVVYDALRFDLQLEQPFVVHHAVCAAWPIGSRVVAGPAFTCRGERVADAGEIRDHVRLQMFQHFSPACVQVIDTGGDASVAHFGDISGRLAREHGALGVVIDGFTRDVRLLERDGFPVFCRGVQPIDAYGRWQIVEYQGPVSLDGLEGRVRVAAGDWVFADADGVLVIPAARIEEACARAEARLVQENAVRERLAGVDPERLYAELGRW